MSLIIWWYVYVLLDRIVRASQDPGILDKIRERGCSVHVVIPVLFQEGQSISESQDTLKKGVQCACAHPCTVRGWSEYLGISGYSNKGVQCACAHLCIVPGWSDYLGVSGYSLTKGLLSSSVTNVS